MIEPRRRMYAILDVEKWLGDKPPEEVLWNMLTADGEYSSCAKIVEVRWADDD